MTPDRDFSFEPLAAEMIQDVVDTVADFPGLSQAERFRRQQTVTSSVKAFLPRDPIELMLAGHCVIFDHLLRDGAHDLLRGQEDQIKLRTRLGVNATGTMFLKSLAKLLSLRERSVDTGAARPATPATTRKVSVEPSAPASIPPSTPETTVPQSAAPQSPAKPGFVCERVYPPRRPDAVNAPKFGAAYRPRGTPLPFWREKPGTPTVRSRLNGVSHAAMLITGKPSEAELDPLGVLIRGPAPIATLAAVTDDEKTAGGKPSRRLILVPNLPT